MSDPMFDEARAMLARSGAPPLSAGEKARIRARLAERRSRAPAWIVGVALAACSTAAMAAWLGGALPIAPISPVPVPVPVPNPAPKEAQIEDPALQALRQALRALNSDHPAEAAQLARAELDRAPDGPLAPELRLVEVRALVSAGREKDALSALESMPLERQPRADDLAVLRAELWSRQGQCEKVIASRDALIARGLPEPLTDRLRALCPKERP